MSWQYAPAGDVPQGWQCEHPTLGRLERVTVPDPAVPLKVGPFPLPVEIEFIRCEDPGGLLARLRRETMVWVRVPT